MPNHVHLMAVPPTEDGLRRASGAAHRRDPRRGNWREGGRGHLWQGRFPSGPRDGRYLLAAARYLEQHPVRAGLAAQPWAYPGSSAAAHVAGGADARVTVAPLLALGGTWLDFLATGTAADDVTAVRRHERSGRPLGRAAFVGRVEGQLGRSLRPGPPGRKAAGQRQ